MDDSREEPSVKAGIRRRRLRAVLAADIANFGGLVSVDETQTMDALWIARRIAKEELGKHGGWLFGMPGDGVFALFESAIDAVRCALNIQARLAATPKLDALKMRIGVHLGEVLFQDDLPFGESLVIAARLESLAEPGGVLVSSSVMDAVASRIAATFSDMGVRSLKHSPRRIATFSVTAAPGTAGLDITAAGGPLDYTVMRGRPESGGPPAPANGEESPGVAHAPDAAPAQAEALASVEAEPETERSNQEAQPEPAAPPPVEEPATPEQPSAPPNSLTSVLRNLAEVLHLTESEIESKTDSDAHPGTSIHPGSSGEAVAPSPPEHAATPHEAGTDQPPRRRGSILDASHIAPLPRAVPLSLPEQGGEPPEPETAAFEPEAAGPDHVEPEPSTDQVTAHAPAPAQSPGAAEDHHHFGDPVTPAGLAEIARVLTTHVGPVAKLLVRRHAAEAASSTKLIRLLAQEIPAETERHDFVRHAHEALSALSDH